MMNLQLLMQLNIYKNWTIIIRIYHVQGNSLWQNFFLFYSFFSLSLTEIPMSDALEAVLYV